MKTQYVTRRGFLKKTGHGLMAAAFWNLTSLASAASRKPNKPNIILVLTDDQGWTDTSVQMMKDRPDSRSDFYQTPTLERMAGQGMIFSNAYSPAPTCTPTRTSIQFGKTPARLRQTIVNDVLAKSRGIDCRNETAIPQMIKSADPNYVTAHFGKWGIDVRKPEAAGYDVTDGNTNNGEGDWLVHRKTRLPEDDPKRIFSVTRRANAFMEQQVKTGRPFFMQVSHYAVHSSYFALKETIAKYRNLAKAGKYRTGNPANEMAHPDDATIMYAAMVENLDTAFGKLLDKIEQLGITGNTYVIYTSDNGGMAFKGNGPLKGSKANLWEGGIRVPTVVRGPDVLKGTYCDMPITGWDFYPTINELIGGKPLPKEFDGGSLCDFFRKGNDGAIKRGTEQLIFNYPWYTQIPMAGIRDGDYKLIKNLVTQEIRLYNLADDLGETKDLAKKMPAKTKEMHERMLDYFSQVDAEDVRDMFAARRKGLHERMKREMMSPKPDEERLKRYRIDIANVDWAERNKEW